MNVIIKAIALIENLADLGSMSVMGILRQLPIDAQHMVNGPNTGRDMPH